MNQTRSYVDRHAQALQRQPDSQQLLDLGSQPLSAWMRHDAELSPRHDAVVTDLVTAAARVIQAEQLEWEAAENKRLRAALASIYDLVTAGTPTRSAIREMIEAAMLPQDSGLIGGGQ